jgi:glycosyltransferase involved in cell wall biosynthesis
MKEELVTVITANYNAADFIVQTIESVLAQEYENWEMIIIDDLSSDGSIEIIQDYIKKDSRIRLIQLDKNGGPAVARNTGIKEGKGRYIAFLDSDDIWTKDKLNKQITFMQVNNIPFSYASYDLIDEDNNDKGEFLVQGKVNYTDLLKTCDIGCLTAVYDTHILDKTEMPLILRRQDYGLWLRLLKKTEYAYAMEDKVGIYRLRKSSISSNKRKAAGYQWKIYREIEKLNIVSSVYYFLNYAIKGFFKYRS